MPFEIPLLALLPAVIIAAQSLLAPIETLLWTAGWTRDEVGRQVADLRTHQGPVDRPSTAYAAAGAPAAFLVYLDGIGKTAPRDTRVARTVIARLRAALPRVTLLSHVMPYSVSNRALLERPVSGRYWRFLRRHRLRLLMFVNNVLQVLVACDGRYRDAYGRGIAHTVLAHLDTAGYRADPAVPVVLVGYSGGMQAAATALRHIAPHVAGPLVVIGIGGFHDGAGDLTAARAVHTLVSDRDVIEHLGRRWFWRRWAHSPGGQWRHALNRGVVVEHDMTPAEHFGPRAYVSPAPAPTGDGVIGGGTSHLDRTVAVITDIVTDWLPAHHRTPSPAVALALTRASA